MDSHLDKEVHFRGYPHTYPDYEKATGRDLWTSPSYRKRRLMSATQQYTTLSYGSDNPLCPTVQNAHQKLCLFTVHPGPNDVEKSQKGKKERTNMFRADHIKAIGQRIALDRHRDRAQRVMTCTVMEAAKGMLYCLTFQHFKPAPFVCVWGEGGGGVSHTSRASSMLQSTHAYCLSGADYSCKK